VLVFIRIIIMEKARSNHPAGILNFHLADAQVVGCWWDKFKLGPCSPD